MLYCLSFGSLNFREAEELLLGVTLCIINVTKVITIVNLSPQGESKCFANVLKFVKKIAVFK
jgi:hypothetical protein